MSDWWHSNAWKLREADDINFGSSSDSSIVVKKEEEVEEILLEATLLFTSRNKKSEKSTGSKKIILWTFISCLFQHDDWENCSAKRVFFLNYSWL